MTKRFLSLNAFASLFLLLFLTATVEAQIRQRTFASIYGSDANDCSELSPCRNFQAAIDKAQAGGEVVALTSGGFGSVNITKAITITGEGVHAVTRAGSGDAVTINAPGAVVSLRHLFVQNNTSNTGTNGVHVLAAAAVFIEHCTVNGFSSDGVHYNATGKLIITDTTIRNNSDEGLDIRAVGGAAFVTLDRTRILNNSEDGADFNQGNIRATITNSVSSENGDDGFEFDSVGNVQVNIAWTTAANNGDSGFYLASGSGQVNIEYSKAHNNVNSGFEVASATMRVGYSSATANTTGFNHVGGVFQSLQNNLVRGNGANTFGTISAISGT